MGSKISLREKKIAMLFVLGGEFNITPEGLAQALEELVIRPEIVAANLYVATEVWTPDAEATEVFLRGMTVTPVRFYDNPQSEA